MNRSVAFNLFNMVGFQAVWLASVAGAGNGLVWPGLVACTVFTALVLGLGGRRRDDLRALFRVLPLGLAVDSMFAASGWLHYAAPWPSTMAAPVWIGCLWVGFILTLNHSLGFLRSCPWWAALFGLIGGPLAYLASERAFAAVEFGVAPGQVLVAVAIAWALVVPAAFVLARARLPEPSLAHAS